MKYLPVVPYWVLSDGLDNDYNMQILELSTDEVSLLQMCVALVLGRVFQNRAEGERMSKRTPEN